MGLEEAHVNLQGISKSFGDPAHEPIWRQFMVSETPQNIRLPSVYEETLTSF